MSEKKNETENRDWVEETYECFIKNATDLEPTNPVKAIDAYFEKNATTELKEQAKTEGKTAETCWRFIEAVARKALHGSGHIDPVVVYAIAMHYFQDVPVSWDENAKREKIEKSENTKKTSPAKRPERSKAKKLHKAEQGFFFDMMENTNETEQTTNTKEN